jgi:hypothetical protein
MINKKLQDRLPITRQPLKALKKGLQKGDPRNVD